MIKIEFNKCKRCGYRPVSLVDSVSHSVEGCKDKQKKLWVRKLECGHERNTGLEYASDDFGKPNIGNMCYCRTCMDESKIIGVELANEQEHKDVKTFVDILDKIKSK